MVGLYVLLSSCLCVFLYSPVMFQQTLIFFQYFVSWAMSALYCAQWSGLTCSPALCPWISPQNYFHVEGCVSFFVNPVWLSNWRFGSFTNSGIFFQSPYEVYVISSSRLASISGHFSLFSISTSFSDYKKKNYCFNYLYFDHLWSSPAFLVNFLAIVWVPYSFSLFVLLPNSVRIFCSPKVSSWAHHLPFHSICLLIHMVFELLFL